MKKIIFFALIATAVLAGCARVETVETPADNQYAIDFGGYSGNVITKAGVTDDMNLDALKTHGFGVFATYTGTDDFDAFGGADNLFMNNEKVAYSTAATAWTYSPIRYWPNPTGGKSADDQHVSFFAYAPHCTPAAGETTGITGFDTQAVVGTDPTTGDPITVKHNLVHYAFDPAGPNVDLMWGYKTKTVIPGTPATTSYTVNKDLTRTAGTVHFVFRHMLSKLGGSQEGITDPTASGYKANGLIIKASPTADPTNAYITGTPGEFGSDTGTKITVSEIIVESAPETEGTPAAAVKDINGNDVVYATTSQPGTLDLYTGKFTLDGTPAAAPKPVRFYQKISADATAVAAGASELADYLKEVPGVTDFSQIKTGVIKQPRNVYADESNPIILLPGTAPVVDVTITYTVRTYDAKLPARSATVANSTYTEVPQTVFGRVCFPTIEENKKYNLCIILGLNDVKFSATVEDWTPGNWTDTNGNGVIDDGELTGTEKELWLPANVTVTP